MACRRQLVAAGLGCHSQFSDLENQPQQSTPFKVRLVGLGRPCILVRVVVAALVVRYVFRADAFIPKFSARLADT